MALARKNARKSERGTGLAMVRAWIGSFKSTSEAAKAIPITPGHLGLWLWQRDRRFSPDLARRVAIASGVPLEAVLFKNEQVDDLVQELRSG